MTFSFAGYGISNVLSDWYPIDGDTEVLIEKIHVANMSCVNAAAYFFDFIYSVGRQYYFCGSSVNSYVDIPVDYRYRDENYSGEKGELQLLLKHLADIAELRYGDDYLKIEFAKDGSALSNFDADDLDMLLLDDLDSDDDDIAPDAELEKEIEEELREFEGESDIGEGEDEREAEDYEYLSQEIFDDPLLMIDHLKQLF